MYTINPTALVVLVVVVVGLMVLLVMILVVKLMGMELIWGGEGGCEW